MIHTHIVTFKANDKELFSSHFSKAKAIVIFLKYQDFMNDKMKSYPSEKDMDLIENGNALSVMCDFENEITYALTIKPINLK